MGQLLRHVTSSSQCAELNHLQYSDNCDIAATERTGTRPRILAPRFGTTCSMLRLTTQVMAGSRK